MTSPSMAGHPRECPLDWDPDLGSDMDYSDIHILAAAMGHLVERRGGLVS